MRDDPAVVDLVTRAGAGDEGAWNEIVERYIPLVWKICVRYQLSAADILDVGTVQLVTKADRPDQRSVPFDYFMPRALV